jgi:hypothetical protein
VGQALPPAKLAPGLRGWQAKAPAPLFHEIPRAAGPSQTGHKDAQTAYLALISRNVAGLLPTKQPTEVGIPGVKLTGNAQAGNLATALSARDSCREIPFAPATLGTSVLGGYNRRGPRPPGISRGDGSAGQPGVRRRRLPDSGWVTCACCAPSTAPARRHSAPAWPNVRTGPKRTSTPGSPTRGAATPRKPSDTSRRRS